MGNKLSCGAVTDEGNLRARDCWVWLRRGGHWLIVSGGWLRVCLLCCALLKRGMGDAGTFTITELPGTIVRFFIDGPNSLYAAIYEHPKVGCWAEVITRYQDNTSATVTMRPALGFAKMPGYVTIHAPGASVDALCNRLLRERPRKAPVELSRFNVARLFEAAWADQIRWRKQRGGRAEEVAQVIMATSGGLRQPAANDQPD